MRIEEFSQGLHHLTHTADIEFKTVVGGRPNKLLYSIINVARPKITTARRIDLIKRGFL